MVFCGVQIWQEYSSRQKDIDAFAELSELAEIKEPDEPKETAEPDTDGDAENSDTDSDTQEEQENPVLTPRHDIPLLISQNSDCIGWITIDNTVVDYPVMHTPEWPQKYLRMNFYQQYSDSGVPFLDYRCTLDSDNLIIFGHNMRNGTMFSTLKDYLNEGRLASDPTILLETEDGVHEFTIFAVACVDKLDSWYSFINAESEDAFNEAVQRIIQNAYYTNGDAPEYGDRLLTLSTCYGSTRSSRLIIIAKEEKQMFGKPKLLTPAQMEEIRTKDFFDMILPGSVKFLSDHYVVGDSYRSVWVIREYPPSTEEQAILSQLADRSGVTLRIYHRLVESMEQRKIIQNATRRNKLKSGGNDVNDTIEAEGNLQDVIELLANLRKNKEPLLHCSVFIELKARSMDALKELQSDIAMELTRSKISVDRLTLRQKEGFLSVIPTGYNQFGAQYERVLPASSVANLYPFNFSGKTDPQGLYIGRDKYGTNILVDFDRRAEDKTTSNILILGNSGQGKSYLLKLILTNIRESGKAIICLDPESEYEELCNALGGCYIDFMSGEYTINPLEPKAWTDSVEDIDATTPEAFKKVTRLSQHIAFLKDFFRSYKDFSDTQIDTIEILLSKLYARFGITDATDYSTKKPTDFPIMEDFYKLCEEEFYSYDKQRKYLYTEDTLQDVCLGIHSMCVGAESKYFNGHTNITDSHFLVFGVKGLMDTNKRLKDAMLFNILSFMSNQLLGQGKTAASIDELYLFLTNMTAIEYIRNAMKRVRKKDSSIILASQNIEDFLIPSIREFTKPLFSIPTHQFLFNAGQINPKEYMDALQVEPSEFELIKYPERGTCLFRCGNERYLLQVIAPDYKAALFGKAGGR